MTAWNPLRLLFSRRDDAPGALAALSTARAMIGLLASLQQHRGISTAWLAGDRSFEGRMQQRRRDIDGQIPALRPGFETETLAACPCFTVNDWKLFRFKWRELLEAMPGATGQDNIEGHNQLIAQLLDWLAALGEARIELPAAALSRAAVRNLARRLPALAECLGQARALGAAVAARGTCSPVARVRLGYLAGRAEALVEEALAADAGSRAGEEARRLILAMTGLVRRELLVRGAVAIPSQTWFDAATRAIDAVFVWMESSAREVEAELSRPGFSPGPGDARWSIGGSAPRCIH